MALALSSLARVLLCRHVGRVDWEIAGVHLRAFHFIFVLVVNRIYLTPFSPGKRAGAKQFWRGKM
jgi:hypothetical protein